MIKYDKIQFLLLSLFMLSTPGYGQGNINFNDNISEKFRKYCDAVPREEIFIHTDRIEYVAGENLWFSMYLIDRQSSRPSSTSQIAYFELLNPENLPIVQKRFRIEKGFGPGQIILPDTLTTGRYTIRVYTNRMKNFLPVNCFMREINIYNAISDRTLARRSNSPDILPQEDKNNNSHRNSESGIVLKVNNLKPDTLEIFIASDENYRSVNSNICYMFVQTHGVVNSLKTVKLTSDDTRVIIPKDILIPGITHITLFDSNIKPLVERFIYTPSKETGILSLNLADSFKVRNKISLEMKFGKQIISSLNSANLSISVTPHSDYQDNSDIADYMVFGTEFGVIPDEIRNCNLNKLSPEILDDFLLNVKSNWIDWNAILSGNFPVLKYKTEKEDHILSGRLINRNSTDLGNDKYLFLSIPGKTAIFKYARTDSTGSFSFRLPVNEEAREIIIQPEEVTRNSTIRIESSFSEEYLKTGNAPESLVITSPQFISKWSVNYQVNKIYELPSSEEPLTIVKPLPKIKRFYGKPDIELLLDNYIKLPVMEEVFFELTPGVFLKSKKSKYAMSIADPVDNTIYKKPPVLFIDGVVINDPAVLAGLDPAIVEKIDIVNVLYLVGDYYFFGLVNVITRAGDYSSVTLPDYAVRLHYKAVDPVRSFYSPDYSTSEMKERRIPDFRNTLYWNPSVNPDENGKAGVEFWSSDISGYYDVNIQGITSDGKACSYRKIIKVE